MKSIFRVCITMILTALLTLTAFAPVALAANATEVYVNNVKLDKDNPYWKNGNAAASKDDGNAYFDETSATLTLYNAVINTARDTLVSGTYRPLVSANGDVTVVLSGANSLQYNDVLTGQIAGIYASGTTTIRGSGSLDIQIENAASTTFTFAIYSYRALSIQGGTISIAVHAGTITHGLYSRADIWISGGQTTIDNRGERTRMVYTEDGDFRMTGGTVTGSAESSGSSGLALYAEDITLEGGEGIFKAFGVPEARGLSMWDADLIVSGGHFVFMGEEAALRSYISNLSVIADGILIYVSESSDGAAKWRWLSIADGELAETSTKTTPFLYVEFLDPSFYGTMPQTGDGQTPWLWAGMSLCVLIGAAGLIWALRRKRK